MDARGEGSVNLRQYVHGVLTVVIRRVPCHQPKNASVPALVSDCQLAALSLCRCCRTALAAASAFGSYQPSMPRRCQCRRLAVFPAAAALQRACHNAVWCSPPQAAVLALRRFTAWSSAEVQLSVARSLISWKNGICGVQTRVVGASCECGF